MAVPGTSANPLYVQNSSSSPVSVGTTSDTATVTSVNDSDTNQTLLAANTERRGYKIFNESTAVLYVKEGTTASASSYSYQIAAGGFYESGSLAYRGRIDGIWASNQSGAARITELT